MKKMVLVAVAVAGAYSGNAQTGAKLSAFTRQYLQRAEHLRKGEHLPDYVYKKINSKLYLSAMIKVGADVDQSKLDAMGVLVGTRAGCIWTVQIPVDQVAAFVTVKGVSCVDLDMPVFPFLDSARKTTRADSAQKGINLPSPITGSGVVVGVVDAGFDFTHPTFYDTTHSAYRVKRVWTQKIAGTPPAGYPYGSELTDSNAIRARGYDTTITSHGSHVAGIAAGSGYGSNTGNARFRGMAFESDLVMVGIMPAPEQWAAGGESDIIDGIRYVYSYAASVGKPAVVNLSWGATVGPHDGNSLFSQACDGLTGAGKIFVCAAGNNGEDTVHLQKAFTPADNSVSTFVTFSPYLDTDNQKTWVDVWGDTSKTFCLNVKLYNGAAAIDSTGPICIADTTHTYNLIGSNGDTCFVTISMVASEYNDKPHALVYMHSRVHDNICLTTTATDGVVDMWEGYVLPPTGYYGALKKLGYSWAVSGDANMTVSDIGCTRSAITVGAYTSKPGFVNVSGTSLYYPGAVRGKIAPFSSFGPTEDYRVKPDITAPGFALASAVSSYDTSYNPTGPNYNGVISQYADAAATRTYRYAMLPGTSMASPCVAGIVAMFLQVDPSLTPDSVRSIISDNAITDAYTGTLPASGNNTWGHGKINAYRSLKFMTAPVGVQDVAASDRLACLLYPNPNNGNFFIDYKSDAAAPLTVEVTDITGKTYSTQRWQVQRGNNTHEFSTAGLRTGVYLVRVSSATRSNVVRMEVE